MWPDQDGRLERLQRAIEVARRDPPELIRGDYVAELPSCTQSSKSAASSTGDQKGDSLLVDRMSEDEGAKVTLPAAAVPRRRRRGRVLG